MSLNHQLPVPLDFKALNISTLLISALEAAGYEKPTPIQEKTIPHLMAGKDLIGQAQTGTGKTAAFALPILSRIDLKFPVPQVLVLTPTRELAIQVSESFHQYAVHLKGFRALPIYGGQDYGSQLRRLKQGVHVVVGTPGRIMDHMRRKSLKLDAMQHLVLDEADEMLRMGFIYDVEWILGQTPPDRQISLFSATIPQAIRKIAEKHMNYPEQITVKARTMTLPTTRQRYWIVGDNHKLDALTRILEAEPFDGLIIFVRTKTATLELAKRLEARGYLCAALNGDISQSIREETLAKLKSGVLDILVATDVAARGLDVDRVSHVINYDVPYDPESYVHRIGRTGRAGRSGEAILFVTPRERRVLRAIEKVTRQDIEMLKLPTTEMINDHRIARFKQAITDTLAENDLGFFHGLMDQYRTEHDVPALDIAAALAKMVQGKPPLLLPEKAEPGVPAFEKAADRQKTVGAHKKSGPETNGKGLHRKESDRKMERFRVEVGRRQGVKPGNIVRALANEAGIDPEYIGRIEIHNDFAWVDLPMQMPADVLRNLKTVSVAGQQLGIIRVSAKPAAYRRPVKPGKARSKNLTENRRPPFGMQGKRKTGRRKIYPAQ